MKIVPEPEQQSSLRTPRGLLLATMDIEEKHEADFNQWYDEEHFPERMGCPGFLWGARFRALEGSPKYLAMYLLESPDVLNGDSYLAMSRASPWTSRVSRNWGNFRRNVYEEITPPGGAD